MVFCSIASFAQETIIPDVNPAELDKYIQMAKEFMPKRKRCMYIQNKMIVNDYHNAASFVAEALR